VGRIRRFISVLQLAALAMMPSIGRAAPPGVAEPPGEAAPPAEGERARLLAAADAAMRDGRFADARNALLAIWEATGEREAACNVGRLSFRIGDMPRAVELLQVCVSSAPEETEEAESIRLELTQARRQVVELRVRAPSGTDIVIDGRARGRAPLVAYLPPGEHTVRGIGPKGSEALARIHGSAGESRVVELDLTVPGARPKGWIVAGGGVASAVLLSLGGALTVASYVEKQRIDKSLPEGNGCDKLHYYGCRNTALAYEAAFTMRGWGVAGLIAGAGAAGATLTYALWPRGRVSVSTAGAGIRVEGAW
jgi:hypothetical protein